MKNNKIYINKEKITEQLQELCSQCRKELGLSQGEVAEQIGRSEKTYQRLESTGKGLANIFLILKLFRALECSTTDIISALELPPLTLNEIKDIYQDQDTLKSIKEGGIYSYMRANCGSLDDLTIEKLFFLLCEEHTKRRQSKHGNHPRTT